MKQTDRHKLLQAQSYIFADIAQCAMDVQATMMRQNAVAQRSLATQGAEVNNESINMLAERLRAGRKIMDMLKDQREPIHLYGGVIANIEWKAKPLTRLRAGAGRGPDGWKYRVQERSTAEVIEDDFGVHQAVVKVVSAHTHLEAP